MKQSNIFTDSRVVVSSCLTSLNVRSRICTLSVLRGQPIMVQESAGIVHFSGYKICHCSVISLGYCCQARRPEMVFSSEMFPALATKPATFPRLQCWFSTHQMTNIQTLSRELPRQLSALSKFRPKRPNLKQKSKRDMRELIMLQFQIMNPTDFK